MTRLMAVLFLRLRSLFRRSGVDRDLDRELRFHLEEHIAELVAAGASPADARAAAMREFGSPASVAQQCRETRRVNFVQNLLQDTRYALRTLAKQPMLLVTAVSSIALGAGANLAIFGLANGLLLSTPTATRPENLVHIRTNRGSHASYTAWKDLDASGVMAGIAGHDIESDMNWRGREVSISVTPLVVTANFFDVMGIPLTMGRGFTGAEAAAERDPRVVVISHSFWTAKLAGDPAVLGSSLALERRRVHRAGSPPAGPSLVAWLRDLAGAVHPDLARACAQPGGAKRWTPSAHRTAARRPDRRSGARGARMAYQHTGPVTIRGELDSSEWWTRSAASTRSKTSKRSARSSPCFCS